VTVCVRKYGQRKHGWRVQNDYKIKYNEIFQTLCNSSTNAVEAEECLRNKTFNLSDMVEKVSDGNKSELNETFWREDISFFWDGRCQTLQRSASIEIGTKLGQRLEIKFNTSLEYFAVVHDPNFFVLGTNPLTMPRIWIDLPHSYGEKGYYLRVISHVKMNVPDSPCDDSPSYSLTQCIRNHFSKEVGCRPQWDGWSSQDRTVCTTMEQLKELEKKFYGLSEMERENIQRLTGCQLPCHYNEYQVVDRPVNFDMLNQTIKLVLASKSVLVKTEDLVYPFSSFLAEFGGALGLFLGFSFIMVWDMIRVFLHRFLVRIPTKFH
jgi:hypothetical protein